jgi:hypothetical protein
VFVGRPDEVGVFRRRSGMRIVGVAAAMLVVAGLAFGGAAQAQQPQTMKGHLVDVMCPTKHAT